MGQEAAGEDMLGSKANCFNKYNKILSKWAKRHLDASWSRANHMVMDAHYETETASGQLEVGSWKFDSWNN